MKQGEIGAQDNPGVHVVAADRLHDRWSPSGGLPRGCAATYFPETNVLVPARHVAHTSNTPASKSVVVTLSADAHLKEA